MSRGWECGCVHDQKHTACPTHAKSDVYLMLSAPPAEALDFEAARTEALRADYTAMGETFQSNVPWAQYEAMYKMPLMSSLRAALNTQVRALLAQRAERIKGTEYVVEAVEWSHPSNDIPEGATRLTVKGVIQPVGAGDTILYRRLEVR